MKKEIITWIVALDAKHAHILQKNHLLRPKIKLIKEINSEPNLEHQKPGRTFDSMGFGRHAIEPHTDPRQVERQHFVTKIIEILEEGLKNHQFEKLITIASPKMLGLMTRHLTRQLSQKLIYKLPKNILNSKIANVEKYINEVIDFRILSSMSNK